MATVTTTKKLALPALPQGIAGPEGQALVLQINDRLRRIALGLTSAATTTGTGGGGGGTGGTTPPPATSLTFVTVTPSGTLDGFNAGFTIPDTPAAGSLLLFLNGVAQDPAIDYTASGSTISYAIPPKSTDTHFAYYAH